ncbi:ribosomal-protein-alanine N-acetyltransferase [Salinibacillus kushneri]|uniref:[Ribosomal protein bS18]-alanine N-acetyltransferase n=1 Tax=Salinibacillus kushneri TaxID=237682 RepID=A0A1I0J4Y4_9BACI|nr:ribosomal protein S18-alanine N-acetyltransferase [Salinibacillus kushneri]SEU04827.1 ribosomal-protein-alanine N-acetyltransferase [Salinibacillus kushneri]
MGDVSIRPMGIQDLNRVMEIEKRTFITPWDEGSFRSELQQNKFAHYYVIEDHEVPFGYCGLWIVYEAAQITNIAILPEYRGNKYGQQLFSYVLNEARALNAQELSLEVRVSNLPAQKMYQKFGMVPVGIRKNYYIDNHEDAIVMWVKL